MRLHKWEIFITRKQNVFFFWNFDYLQCNKKSKAKFSRDQQQGLLFNAEFNVCLMLIILTESNLMQIFKATWFLFLLKALDYKVWHTILFSSWRAYRCHTILIFKNSKWFFEHDLSFCHIVIYLYFRYI